MFDLAIASPKFRELLVDCTPCWSLRISAEKYEENAERTGERNLGHCGRGNQERGRERGAGRYSGWVGRGEYRGEETDVGHRFINHTQLLVTCKDVVSLIIL